MFYKYICFTALIFTLLHKSDTDENTELVYPEVDLKTPSPLSIGLVFIVKINNTSNKNDYDIEITPDECCLKEEGGLDCDSLQILGGGKEFVSKEPFVFDPLHTYDYIVYEDTKEDDLYDNLCITKAVLVVAPLLCHYKREGHCTFFVDSKTNNDLNKRDTLKINFDTGEENNNLDNFKRCKHDDEDPFNNCRPVNCDTYYNGKKPYFNRRRKRCVPVPRCVKGDDYDYPTVIYNPISNHCLQETIHEEDLEYIKDLNKDNEKRRKTKDVLIINKFDPNISDVTNEDTLIDHIVATTRKQENTKYSKVDTLNIKPITRTHKKVDSFKLFLKKYILDNKWTLIVLVLVVAVQCLLICTMIYCLSKTCTCCEDKQVIRKFFNYRQDVSVTTPLIGTSNMNTETTEYQNLSESFNNIDQKIKCYKACQKEKNNNVKMSMSDDILSKCLNRRDWKKFKCQAATQPDNTETVEKISDNRQSVSVKTEENTAPNEIKVMFEDEKISSIQNKPKVTNIVSEIDISKTTKDNKDVRENVSSEKEIKCHSYNRFDKGVREFRANLTNNVGAFKNIKSKKGAASNSTEKGAQAYFSNDSIDDMLSERGVIYLAGENLSKYTFSSGSNAMKPSIPSSVSSKTSKNFIKNVLSLLQKRSKQGPSSDPGQNKEIDVELIHMSRASIYSSTNDSDCIKSLKRKDSRTSF